MTLMTSPPEPPAWKAQYPQRSCRIAVAGQWQDFPCEATEHHLGPCASQSVPESVRRREQWEADNPDAKKLTVFSDPFQKAEQILKDGG
jgi:hypothetical protein